MSNSTDLRTEFGRALYNETINWYKNADTKAQILLTLVGAFIAFLTSSVFIDLNRLSATIKCVPDWSWILLTIMATTVTGAVLCSLGCLWSRTSLSKPERREIYKIRWSDDHKIDPRFPGFFGTIWRLPKQKFKEEITLLDRERELEILVSQIFALSRRVSIKHGLVNVGFICAGVSLLLYLFSAFLYILKVSKGTCI